MGMYEMAMQATGVATGGVKIVDLLNLLVFVRTCIQASRYSRPSWVFWLDALNRSLSLTEAKPGHLGYLPKGRRL